MGNKHISFTVGTTAYNEAKNMGKFLRAVQNQKLPINYVLEEIIVVASGCTDKTIDIVKKNQKKDKRIRLITQQKREGKAVAVNLLLNHSKTDIIFLQSTDTLPARSCYRLILDELKKDDVGLVAGKVVPKDNKNTFIGYANHLKWELHHHINLRYPERPKVGEFIAFKKIFERIPPETSVDEASIEPLIHLQGYKIKYVPRAKIYNHGPKNLREYMSQRRHYYAGHYVTKKKYAYEVVTFSGGRIFPVFLDKFKKEPEKIHYGIFIALLEVVGRFVGYLDVKFKLRSHTVWKMAKTSKGL